MTLVNFRLMFPEFATAPDNMVQKFLDTAEKAVSSDVFGTRFDEGHGYLTAHLLSISPYGKNARLQSEKGETTFGKRYEQIRAEVTVGFRVI